MVVVWQMHFCSLTGLKDDTPWNSDFWACSILRSTGSELKDLRGCESAKPSIKVFASMRLRDGARGLRELEFRMLHACSIENSMLHVLRDISGTDRMLHLLREFREFFWLAKLA